jgi:xylulokinase
MEGLAYNNRWTRQAAEKFIGRRIDCFRFSGGGALSDVWCQIHADVLGVPIQQVDDPINATVRGTALLALITLGYRSIDEIPNLVRFKRIFKPDESNRETYDRMYAQYRALFKKNKRIFKELNKPN